MSIQNVERLKKRFGLEKSGEFINKYFLFIDLIYYERLIVVEHFDEDKDEVTWSFEDGTIIKMDMEDMANTLLFVLDLSEDADEQLYGFEEIREN